MVMECLSWKGIMVLMHFASIAEDTLHTLLNEMHPIDTWIVLPEPCLERRPHCYDNASSISVYGSVVVGMLSRHPASAAVAAAERSTAIETSSSFQCMQPCLDIEIHIAYSHCSIAAVFSIQHGHLSSNQTKLPQSTSTTNPLSKDWRCTVQLTFLHKGHMHRPQLRRPRKRTQQPTAQTILLLPQTALLHPPP